MGHSRLNWTPQEEQALKLYKQRGDFQGWKQIAEELNKKFQSRNRTGKQCRERYMNYIKFGQESLKLPTWTNQQDQALFQNFQLYGARWVLISRQMPHRSQNSLKNRFYGILRKIMRKIEKITRLKRIKKSKTLKLATLIQILEKNKRSKSQEGLNFQDELSLSHQLSKQLFKLGMNRIQEPNQEEVMETVRKLHQFIYFKKCHQKKTFFIDKLSEENIKKFELEPEQKDVMKFCKLNQFCEKQAKQSNDSRVSLDKIIEIYEKEEKERKKQNIEEQQQLSLPYQFNNMYQSQKNNSYDILDEIEATEYF